MIEQEEKYCQIAKDRIQDIIERYNLDFKGRVNDAQFLESYFSKGVRV